MILLIFFTSAGSISNMVVLNAFHRSVLLLYCLAPSYNCIFTMDPRYYLIKFFAIYQLMSQEHNLKIRWPEVISNNQLWDRTRQAQLRLTLRNGNVGFVDSALDVFICPWSNLSGRHLYLCISRHVLTSTFLRCRPNEPLTISRGSCIYSCYAVDIKWVKGIWRIRLTSSFVWRLVKVPMKC